MTLTLPELVSCRASKTDIKLCKACKRPFVPVHGNKGLYCYYEDCIQERERARYRQCQEARRRKKCRVRKTK